MVSEIRSFLAGRRSNPSASPFAALHVRLVSVVLDASQGGVVWSSPALTALGDAASWLADLRSEPELGTVARAALARSWRAQRRKVATSAGADALTGARINLESSADRISVDPSVEEAMRYWRMGVAPAFRTLGLDDEVDAAERALGIAVTARSNPSHHDFRYAPEENAPEEGIWDRSGPEPRWSQDHLSLVRGALSTWKGDPVEVAMHFDDERRGAPPPGSGSGKIRRAQAGALLWELDHHARPTPRPLYRGSHLEPQGEEAWSERRAVAKTWARKNSGRVFELPTGTLGLRVADYIENGLDASEREWIVRNRH